MKTPFNIEEHASHFGGKFQVQISDHPKSGLIRVIDYFGANISHRYKQIEHDAQTHYFSQEGEPLPEFTHRTKQREREWKVDNSYKIIEREKDGTPKHNDHGEEITHPAYDYFIEVVYTTPLPLKNIIIASIQIDDANQLFD